MPVLIIFFGIIILLLLIIRFKLNAFLALILVAIGVGLAEGMSVNSILQSVQKGVGSTLGYLALVLGFGAMLGALLADSGAAQGITQKLIDKFGRNHIRWAVILTGFIIGIPMFYTVGFVILIPLIFAVAKTARVPMLYVGIPMVCSLSVTHGFLPPHPAPTAIAVMYGADMSLTFLYGLILAVPTVIIAGYFFGGIFKDRFTELPDHLFNIKNIEADQLPSYGVSLMTALSPVLLMTFGAFAKLLLDDTSVGYTILTFIGEPVMALLVALLIGIYTLGIKQGKTMQEIMDTLVDSVKAIAMILLIIGAGGAFKQVLVDSGTSEYIVDQLQDTVISPLLLAWGIAALLRITLGSATVAALTAAGIAAPLIGQTSVTPELLVLATGAGSLTCSNVNDTGFWLFKEYFNLSVIDTFKSWTVMETIVSIVGLAGCFLLEMII
jgi:gluconate transporter